MIKCIILFTIILLIQSCDSESQYYNSEYYKENNFFEICLKEGRTLTECDLLYQEKKTMEAQQRAAERVD